MPLGICTSSSKKSCICLNWLKKRKLELPQAAVLWAVLRVERFIGAARSLGNDALAHIISGEPTLLTSSLRRRGEPGRDVNCFQRGIKVLASAFDEMSQNNKKQVTSSGGVKWSFSECEKEFCAEKLSRLQTVVVPSTSSFPVHKCMLPTGSVRSFRICWNSELLLLLFSLKIFFFGQFVGLLTPANRNALLSQTVVLLL